MAGQNLEFTISASDQASKVVTSVQGKIQNFGKDVGKSIAGVLGPMALVGYAVSAVTNYLADMEKKAKEAFDWGSKIADSAEKLNVTNFQFQQIQNAADATGQSVDDVGKAFKLAADLIAQGKAGNADAVAKLNALGISVEDLGKTKPEEVLERLAGAMAQGATPAEKMAIAMSALGSSAKDLQKVLEKGFDIQGAFMDTEGLNDAEIAILRKAKKREREKENREKLEDAKETARKEFSESTEGQKFRYKVFSETQGRHATDAELDAEMIRIEKLRKAEEEANKTIRDLDNRERDKASAERLKKIAEEKRAAEEAAAAAAKAAEEAERAKGKKKEEGEKAKKPPGAGKDLTEFPKALFSTAIAVSSMREIGGGMAGEVAISQEQYQQNQLELLRRAVAQLEIINDRNIGRVDFTKPEYRGIVPPNKFLA